jgi:putative oxidoreductase
MDTVIMILRAVVGLLFIGHGTQKLFGWWGGGGIQGTTGMMDGLGYRPGSAFAIMGGLAETSGGSLLLLGFLTPLGSAAVIAVMTSAFLSVHVRNGVWVTNGGFEYVLVMATVAFSLAFIGPRRFSLDAAIGWHLSGWAWALPSLAAGIAAAVLLDAYRRARLRAPTSQRRQEEQSARPSQAA